MKSVLISIRPEWCEKIASGQKTIEVRKTRPNLPTPFRCYIYCTSGGIKKMPIDYINENFERAKVIGEFVCDSVFRCAKTGCTGEKPSYKIGVNLNRACISYEQLEDYAKGRIIYGWHISELKIYDTPKELIEFHAPCTPSCNFSAECGGVQDGEHCLFPLKRPPQSWCYVE